MNFEKISGVVRHILTFGGGFLVARGRLDEATMEKLISAVMVVAGVAWSWFAPEKKA